MTDPWKDPQDGLNQLLALMEQSRDANTAGNTAAQEQLDAQIEGMLNTAPAHIKRVLDQGRALVTADPTGSATITLPHDFFDGAGASTSPPAPKPKKPHKEKPPAVSPEQQAAAAEARAVAAAKKPKPYTLPDDVEKGVRYLEGKNGIPPVSQRETAAMLADAARSLAKALTDVRDDETLKQADATQEEKDAATMHRELAHMLLSKHNLYVAAKGLDMPKIFGDSMQARTMDLTQAKTTPANLRYLREHPEALEFLVEQHTNIPGLMLLVQAATLNKPEYKAKEWLRSNNPSDLEAIREYRETFPEEAREEIKNFLQTQMEAGRSPK